MKTPSPTPEIPPVINRHPFRTAVIRGLGAFLPPLLTVFIVIWIVNTTRLYLLKPMTEMAREGLVLTITDIRTNLTPTPANENEAVVDGLPYRRLQSGEFIPLYVYNKVHKETSSQSLPETGEGYYRRFIDLTYLRPVFCIPLFLSVFILLLYLLGKFISAEIGGYTASSFDGLVHRVPLVRNVYSATKQISDFFFSKTQFEFRGIVAVEHPRRGIWSMGFVTGEGLPELKDAVGEPLLTVLIPYSPLPVTGMTIVVRKSETVELNVTFDQACEFLVSCGVIIPQQKVDTLRTLPAADE